MKIKMNPLPVNTASSPHILGFGVTSKGGREPLCHCIRAAEELMYSSAAVGELHWKLIPNICDLGNQIVLNFIHMAQYLSLKIC
jgi:hypothetical protein